ncbi:MAG: hypothetical protein ACI9ES_000415 [Oceanospirillaceae bacterium]|jgi:hypothetical protein
MKNQATSQVSLQCFTDKVELVVQLFMSLSVVVSAPKDYSMFSTSKASVDTSFLSIFSMCLPSIYLYNLQQSKLSCFVLI